MVEEKVAAHYKGDGLMDRLKLALRSAGMETGLLALEQLAPLDQFHSRGLEATAKLGNALQPLASDRVIDIGSGLGGPSRFLAASYGCHVTGIDLSKSFVEAANYLAARSGLSELVDYRQGDALSIPFDDDSFDIAWTQHVAMNIADREKFYSEAHRVLRPGGRLAVYDVLQGGGGPLFYPVPWSKTEAGSFLLTPDNMRNQLLKAGFDVVSWADRTDAALAWFADLRKQEASSTGPSPIGLHLAMGPDIKIMTGNLARNFDDGRAVLIEAVLVKSSEHA